MTGQGLEQEGFSGELCGAFSFTAPTLHYSITILKELPVVLGLEYSSNFYLYRNIT